MYLGEIDMRLKVIPKLKAHIAVFVQHNIHIL